MSEGEVKEISIDLIDVDPNQPRKGFSEEKLNELAESIREHGLIEPITVRPNYGGRYEIVLGERRFRACKLIKLPAIKCQIRDISDSQKLELQLTENLQRSDLNPLEEAEAFQRLVREFGYSHAKIARRIGKSRFYVTNKIRLLRLDPDIQNALREGKITEGHARAILGLSRAERVEALEGILEKNWTVRQAENYVRSVSRGTYDTFTITWFGPCHKFLLRLCKILYLDETKTIEALMKKFVEEPDFITQQDYDDWNLERDEKEYGEILALSEEEFKEKYARPFYEAIKKYYEG